MKDISKRIKELRIEQNMTQDDLAERLHVTRQTVSSWETKKTRPDVEMLETIAQVYDMEMTELLYGKKKEQRIEFGPAMGPSNPKMVKQAKIFGVLFVVGFGVRFLSVPLGVWSGGLMDGSYMTMQVIFTVIGVIVGNWGFACLGPFVLSLISIKRDVSIKSEMWRKRVFKIGIILAVAAVLGWPLWIALVLLERMGTSIYLGNMFALLVFVVFMNPYVLTAIASLIWLGKKKSNMRE